MKEIERETQRETHTDRERSTLEAIKRSSSATNEAVGPFAHPLRLLPKKPALRERESACVGML